MPGNRLLVAAALLWAFTMAEAAWCIAGSIPLCMLTSVLGDETIYMVAALAIITLHDYEKGLRIAIYLAVASSIVVLLKAITGVPRPPDPLMEAGGYSFPSGHATLSTAFALALTLAGAPIVLAAPLWIHAAAVSASRLILRVHYPGDVLAGAALAAAIVLAADTMYRISDKRHYVPASGAFIVLAALAGYSIDHSYESPLKLAGVGFGLLAAALTWGRHRTLPGSLAFIVSLLLLASSLLFEGPLVAVPVSIATVIALSSSTRTTRGLSSGCSR